MRCGFLVNSTNFNNGKNPFHRRTLHFLKQWHSILMLFFLQNVNGSVLIQESAERQPSGILFWESTPDPSSVQPVGKSINRSDIGCN